MLVLSPLTEGLLERKNIFLDRLITLPYYSKVWKLFLMMYCYCVAIDTSALKDDLEEGLDYAVISEPAWNIFFSKYGSSQPIPR